MKSKGELLFEEYLAARGLPFRYEPDVGVKKPDYWVETSVGEIVCEVEDFGVNKTDRKRDRDLEETGFATAGGNAYSRIRNKIDKACEQLHEWKGRHPCVVVLHNPGRVVSLATEVVQGAMHGDIIVVLSVPPAGKGPPKTERVEFAPHNAKIRSDKNTTVSAVAILEYYQPDVVLVGQPRIARIRTIHNFFAEVPLALNVFGGKYDEQYVVDRRTQGFAREQRVFDAPTPSQN